MREHLLLRGDQFDSLMNYPLTYGIIDYFALQDTTKQEFMTSVTRSYLCYPKNITEVMFNLLIVMTPRVF